MEFKEAKNKFVQTWGALGSQWGINKTMAQIHALLMVSNEPISMEDIMEELQISRGNASMNLRALMDWGIVYKEYKAGERREFFTAKKDLDELAVKITLDYFHLIQLYNENQLLKIELFKVILNQLKILGINEIHFFVFDEFRIGQNKNYCWENVISAINKSDKKFVIEI